MNNPTGVDISYYEVMWGLPITGKYWNPDNSIKKIDFCIQRSSYGVTEDKCVDFLYKNGSSKIPIRGFYHYFNSYAHYLKQMDVMLKAVEDKEYSFLAVDYETYGNTLDKRTFAEFCEMVKQLKQKTGKKVLSYFSPSVYQTFMKPFGADNVVKDWDIWYAQYSYLYETSLDNYVFPKVKNWNILFHQVGAGDVKRTFGYNEGFNYGSWRHGIDIDAWNGNYQSLIDWCDGEIFTPPTDPPIEPPIIISNPNIVKFNYRMKIRSGAGTSFPQTSLLESNVEVEILSYKYDSQSNIWGKVSAGWVCLKLGSAYYSNKKDFSNVVIESYQPPVIVPPVVVPPQNNKLGIYRVKHDIEYPMSERPTRSLGYIPGKPNSLRGLPEPRRLNGGNKGNIVLSNAWDAYIKKINSPDGYRYVTKQLSGWLNRGEWPHVEQLTFGGNLVDVYKIEGDKYFVRTYFNDQPPPQGIESFTLTQKFSVVYTDGHWVMGTDTPVGMVYIVLIAKPGEKLWIDKNDLIKV